MKVQIAPYEHSLRGSVQHLITAIHQEELQLRVRSNGHSDLVDPGSSYCSGNGNFWIAQDSGRTVGAVGLIDIGFRQFAVRRLFVDREFRGKRHGVSSALLQKVIDWGLGLGYRDLILGSPHQFFAVHRFCEKNGFSLIEISDLPANFPRVPEETVFYAKQV
jgi:GNAT superfamily N-acetyltransferase